MLKHFPELTALTIDVPDGISGPWKIDTFDVTPIQAEIDAIVSYSKVGRSVPAGTYRRLLYNNQTIMTNTPDEMNDLVPFYRYAHGNILITGLGLGVALEMVMLKADVEKVTVIEQSPDVIRLTGGYYREKFGDRLEIIEADAWKYRFDKGVQFEVGWHDIWSGLNLQNISEMKALEKRYKKWCKSQDCWSKLWIEQHQ